MIITCADSCCLINLSKADFVEKIAHQIRRIFYIQGLVEDELNEVQNFGQALLAANLLQPISGSAVFASEVGQIAAPYNIDLGEAECIAIAEKNGYAFATDDNKARKAAQTVLGNHRVVGSLGLLTEAVKVGVIEPAEAAAGYSLMRARGAFLPRVSGNYFETL